MAHRLELVNQSKDLGLLDAVGGNGLNGEKLTRLEKWDFNHFTYNFEKLYFLVL